MRAIVQEAYGSAPERVLRLAEIPKPTLGRDQVLVRVRAASIDRGTVHLMTGLPYLMRVIGFGLRAPKQPNPGRSLAGTVEAAGQDVTAFVPGDEVYGTCDGSFAEYVAAQPGLLAAKPPSASFQQAAAAPVSATAALQAVRDKGEVSAGQTVLVIGAGGGVGLFAVQIAKAFRGHVTGVCSGAQADLVRSVRAEQIIDYTREDFADGRRRFDVIVDIAGNSAAVTSASSPDSSGDARHRRRRDRRTLARWFRPSTADTGVVGFGEPEAHPADIEGERRRPRNPPRADRGRRAHVRHRPDLPSERSR